MNYIDMLTIIILIAIGLIHFYWAFGGKFLIDVAIPTKDGKKLINPGKILTFIVGIIVLSFAFVMYKIYANNTSTIYIYIGWILSAMFGIRAIGDFNMVVFFKKIKDTGFAKYDTKYFSPLCLYLSLSIALSVYSNLN